MTDFDIVDDRFAGFTLPDAGLELLASGFRSVAGPVWMGDAGCLLFQDLPRNRTMRWSETEGVSVYRAPSGYADGQTRDPRGRLVACSHRGRCLYRTELDGHVITLVTHHAGKRLNALNDVVAKSDGTLWFTDSLHGISNDYEGGRQSSEQPPAVYRFDPSTRDIRIVAEDFEGPGGLAFSPDQTRLYVADTGNPAQADPDRHIRAFDVAPDGTLSGADVFYEISPGHCRGMAVDERGNVWASAADGVHCLSPDGRLLGKVRVPQRVANVAFGELHRNRLFIAASHALYAVFLNVRGAAFP